jgi:hypothetical protein
LTLGVEGSGSVRLDEATTGEAALGVEVLGNGGVNGGDFLQRSQAPEAQYRQFSSSERQV